MNKIDKIKSEGLENLQFVLDFDRTITGPINNKSANPMIHYLRNGDMLGEEYRTQAQTNFEKYYPIEKDHEISQEVKNKLMHEWWIAHLSMLVKFKLNKNMISKIANSPDLIPRDGVLNLFIFCNQNNIPIIIFSAGILGSESIRIFLERFNINFSNIKIVINELVFDESGFVSGNKEPVIHSENKNESILEIENIEQRKNTILAGDGFGDIKMVLEKQNSTVFRIGILDSKDQEQIAKYKNYFDIVTDNFNNIINQLK